MRKSKPLSKKNKPSIVKVIDGQGKDFWDTIGFKQQQAIDKALVEMKTGNLFPHNEVMKKYAKWLK